MDKSNNNKYVAYVGTYTLEKSKGIHILDIDTQKGQLTPRKEIDINNPSYITLSHDGRFLYSIADEGVAAYYILPDGDLELMNLCSINGMRGCYLSVTKDNRFLFVSGFHDGKVTVMRINSDGSIGDIADEVYHKGLGTVTERSSRPHIRCATLTPDERFLCVCDLGIDQIKVYSINHRTGKLKLDDIIRCQLDSAPREIIFSEDGRFAYVSCELKNFINVYAYNPNDDDKERFEFVQNIFTLRRDHRASSNAANIIFANNGNNLLCSNAGDNSVTVYKINKDDGTLTMLNSLPISGDYPKYIAMLPDNKHLISMNHEGNSITDFTINFDNGLLIMNGREVKISKPNNMVIKKL